MRAPGRGPAALGAALAWGVALAIVAAHVSMLHRWAVNFPLVDDFSLLFADPLQMADMATWSERLARVFALSPDHRFATQRLLGALAMDGVRHLDLRLLMLYGTLACVAAACVVLARAPSPARAWLAPVAAALVASPALWHGQYWTAAAIQHLAFPLYAFVAVQALGARSPLANAAGALAAVAAACTASSGVFVFAAGAFLAWRTGRPRRALAWVALGALFAGWYFNGYVAPSDHPPATYLLREPWRFALVVLHVMGGVASGLVAGPGLAIGVGSAITLAWVALVVDRTRSALDPVLVAWAGLLAASCAAIAIGRYYFGIEATAASRYRIYSAMLVLVTAVAVARHAQDAWTPRLRRATCAAGLLMTATWSVAAWHVEVPELVGFSLQQRAALNQYLLTGHMLDTGYPGPAVGSRLADLARATDAYSPVLVQNPRHALHRVARERDDPLPTFTKSFGSLVRDDTLSVRGQTWGGAPDLALWLRGDGGTWATMLDWQRIPELRLGERPLAFWGTFPLSALPAGRYEIGYGYDDGPRSPVNWTGETLAH
ncbi:MAG: hypothetical protein JSR18_16045 [Proteobacteria bacterium]|nr:hypothetical protein [Pseudomonadota bacterium]